MATVDREDRSKGVYLSNQKRMKGKEDSDNINKAKK